MSWKQVESVEKPERSEDSAGNPKKARLVGEVGVEQHKILFSEMKYREKLARWFQKPTAGNAKKYKNSVGVFHSFPSYPQPYAPFSL